MQQQTVKAAANGLEDISNEIERVIHQHQFVTYLIEDRCPTKTEEMQVHAMGLYATHLQMARTLKVVQQTADELRALILNAPSGK